MGCVSRIVLGQPESPTKQTMSKRKKSKPTDNSSVTSTKKTTNSHFVRNTLNEEESEWVKRLEKATFTGPYAYAKPPSDKWDSEMCGDVTENAWYEQMIQHIEKQRCGKWLQNQSKEILKALAAAHSKIQWHILRDSVSLQELDMSYEHIIKLRWPKNNEEEDVNKNHDAIIDETIDSVNSDKGEDKHDDASTNVDSKKRTAESVDDEQNAGDPESKTFTEKDTDSPWDKPEYIDGDYDDDLKEDVIVDNTDDKEIAAAADNVIVNAKQKCKCRPPTFQDQQEEEQLKEKQE